VPRRSTGHSIGFIGLLRRRGWALKLYSSLAFCPGSADELAAIGNAASLPPLIAQADFAKEDVQRIVPLIVAISQASCAFAPAVFGAIRSVASDPGGAGREDAILFYAVAATIQLVAIACFVFGRRKD